MVVLFTLWYAFLISALVAERWMFRTSMLVSALVREFARMWKSTVEVDFFGHDCSRLCVCVRFFVVRLCLRYAV